MREVGSYLFLPRDVPSFLEVLLDELVSISPAWLFSEDTVPPKEMDVPSRSLAVRESAS